ncbi:MAG: ABC transporter ATP-binding protein/permease [Clostridia bacterium]|nr:ABC transporter ATP-binding protein/permease [Clostridia bacterium]
MFKKCIKFVKGYWIYTVLCPLFIILDVAIDVELLDITGGLVDVLYQMGESGDMSGVKSMLIKMMLYTLTTLAIGVAANICATKASVGFSTNARKAIFCHVQDFSFENINKFSSTSLITRVTRDINSIQTVFQALMISFIKGPIMVVIALVKALELCKGTNMYMVFVYSVPALVAVLVVLAVIAVPLFKKLMEKTDRFNSVVRQNSNGIRVVKNFVREDYEREKFNTANDDILKWNLKSQNMLLFLTPAIMIIMYACMGFALWSGSMSIIDNFYNPIDNFALTPGKLTTLVGCIMSVLTSLMSVLMIFVSIIAAKASLTRVKEVLMDVPAVRDDEADETLTVEDGSIEFKNVSFRYSQKALKPILENVSLKINSGETIGVIGGTGAGKSTLVQLISRLYDAESGEVCVGGHNIKNYTMFNLREAVSMVLQQNILFSGTIRENIRWGKNDATDEEVINACKMAQADGFINEFNDGYETVLGAGGVNVSGGQKQRLCIARALIKKPKILILDDSTSAVDTETEAKIRQALKSDELKQATKIIIAQRITSVMDADRIVIVENGRINAVGTHEELLENNEIYKEIYQSQQEGVLA